MCISAGGLRHVPPPAGDLYYTIRPEKDNHIRILPFFVIRKPEYAYCASGFFDLHCFQIL